MNDPEKMIHKLDQMRSRLNSLLHVLGLECDQCTEEWEGLGRVGGQRADHAAMLMGRLRPILADLSKTSKVMEDQLTAMIADPFCRQKEVVHAAQ